MSAVSERVVVWCAVVPTLLIAVLCIARPALFTRLEYGIYDRLVRSAGTASPAGRVVIVDVDEPSLEAVGQWPWPRDVVATLITRLRAAGTAAIALDIMFPEPDRRQEGDATLAAALGGGGVVLGYALTFDAADLSAPNRDCASHPLALAIAGPDDSGVGEPYFRASRAVCNLDLLTEAAPASGFLNAAPDADGLLRRVPLLMEFHGRLYPSLALSAVSMALRKPPALLRAANVNATSLFLATDAASGTATADVPLDGRSNLLVRYRGVKHTFPHVSAVDVLKGTVPPEQLQGNVVFVGTTALGTREVVATPLDTLFTGLEVQATVADNLLQGDFFHRPVHGVVLEAVTVLTGGLAAAAIAGRLGVTSGSLTAGALMAVFWGLAVAAMSRYGLVLSPLFPCIGLACSIGSMTAAGLSLERRRADRAGKGQAASQRLMVQTLLALVEMRDRETGRHSRRTQRYTRVLAEQLMTHPRFRAYLTAERVDLLSTLAPLHDIGKVAIPDAILNKPGTLTAQELVEIRRHPAYGREVIENAERAAGVRDDLTLTIAKDIVYTHHERWNGSGYPRGLRGTEIPVPGRLVALVDVYDALRSLRPYHAPCTHDEVMAMIVAERGAHFDPAVVDACVSASEVLRSLSEEDQFESAEESASSRIA